ncbi:hypothetical protein HYH03_013852 [Edaphochlamys debaryana]|uniref:Uncharacterized protein n=1 Tax=Edaphochlamys debaryana TaxID=47281 RepID=A0A836BU47_9CHLO|nr:hypothetical protein HYH03_013852 [Edaphochlamys debaryana]|eukprot:KAG2487573.1 hypothetical protein HYH03_013852 [Edaphochlamys debaryana]
MEEQQGVGYQLLLPFATLKSASPLPTRELSIDATTLSQPAADLISAAFPELERGGLPAAFSCLTSLTVLEARSAHLRVDTLSQLAELEKLSVAGLISPPAGAEAVAGLATAAARWKLPASLKEVHLTSQVPEVLHELRYSPVRQLSWEIKLALTRGLTFDGAASALTEDGESALRSAAEFLAGRLDDESEVEVSRPRRFLGFNVADPTIVLPVGGVAEAGPGRRNHTAWLEALGRVGIPQLELHGFALSHQDLAAIATSTRLKELKLPASTSYPVSGLLSLAQSCQEPRNFNLYVDSWCVRAEDGSCQPPLPVDVCDVLLELNTKYPHVDVQLSCDDLIEKAARLQLHESIKALREDMPKLGGDPGRLYLFMWHTSESDTDEQEGGEDAEAAGVAAGGGEVDGLQSHAVTTAAWVSIGRAGMTGG